MEKLSPNTRNSHGHLNSLCQYFYGENKKKEILRQSAKQPLVWERFIGDIFNLWDTNKEYIQAFFEKSNSYHPTIKFTDEVSENETTFLGTTVYNGERFENESILLCAFTFQTN